MERVTRWFYWTARCVVSILTIYLTKQHGICMFQQDNWVVCNLCHLDGVDMDDIWKNVQHQLSNLTTRTVDFTSHSHNCSNLVCHKRCKSTKLQLPDQPITNWPTNRLLSSFSFICGAYLYTRTEKKRQPVNSRTVVAYNSNLIPSVQRQLERHMHACMHARETYQMYAPTHARTHG